MTLSQFQPGHRLCFIGLIAIISVLASCTTAEPEPESFSGITHTLYDPTPIGPGDPDDWRPLEECPAPDTSHVAIPSCARLEGAYPNPMTGQFALRFQLARSESVAVYVLDKPSHIIETPVHTTLPAGTFQVTINLDGRPNGIYRVYMFVFRGTTSIQSYGDVQLSR